jgi:PAS domain S-box-containing protein
MSTQARESINPFDSQKALRDSEKRFRSLIEHSREVILLSDAQGNYSYASPSVQRVLGYTPEEFVQLNGFTLIHPDDIPSIAQAFQKLLATPGFSETRQFRGRHKNESWRWVEATATNLLDEPGVQAIVTNFHDITERKQTEERQRLLNEVSEMFVSSFDHEVTLKEIAALLVPSLADYCRIAIIDEKQQIKDITANHIEPEKIALVRELYEQYKDRTNTTHGLQKLLETGKAELISIISQEVLDMVQDNPELLTIVHTLGLKSYMGVPLLAQGKIIGAITFSSVQPHRHYTQDDLTFAQELARRIALVLENTRLYREAQEEIAERRQAEAKLRESEERYRLVVEHTVDLITVLDTQATIVFISPSCESMLGYRRDELLGKAALSLIHPDDLPDIEAAFANVLQGKMVNIPFFRAKHKDGHWIMLAGAGSAVCDEQGHPSLIVSTSHDITQQQELERRKDEFISMASHELKTPVTSLKGFIHILQRRLTTQGDELALHYLARMDAQLVRLTKLVNDLLNISKMQIGQLDYREEPFDLNELIQETVENVQGTTQTHSLLLEMQAQVRVLGDRERVGQVLVNLLNNAIKYSPRASKIIVRMSTNQEHACVSVQDFGFGIAEAEQQKIFERFYQAADPMGKTYPGLGIGLYISKTIITQHHGRIWVESRKGEGATFYFTIPLTKEGQHDVDKNGP